MINYIKVFILLICSFNILFANNFKIISRQGDASIIVNKEYKNTDFKENFPKDYFSISTKEASYLVIDNEDKSIILMPNSKLTYNYNKFNLEFGYMYVKTKNYNDIEIIINKDNKSYNFKGKNFALLSYDDEISVLTYDNALKITPEISLGVSYFLEPYHKTYLIPIMNGPYKTTKNEKTLMENVSRQLDSEINEYLNQYIKRYSFDIMENTKNKTTIYRLETDKEGPNVFLIAPHGNERVGTDVLFERFNMPIKRGTLTIVPIAVPEAYRLNKRAIEEQDINNRFFDKDKNKTDTDKLAKKYMDMLDEYKIDVLITLHEGNGFKEFFGDSIIYDTRKLDDKVEKVLNSINLRIEPMKFKFRQMYYPMPTTITFYATKKNIDAFGVELTRNMDYDKKRIIMHTILNEIFKIYDIE